MKKEDDEELVAYHEIILQEDMLEINLRTKFSRPPTFEEYKHAVYDLIHDCDSEGKDLFLEDINDTLLN